MHLSTTRSSTESPFALCPAVPITLWLGLGILAVLSSLQRGIPAYSVAVCTLIAAAALFRLAPPISRRLAWVYLLGAALALLHLQAPWQTYLRHLDRPECSAEIQAVVLKTTPSYESLAWSRKRPTDR